MTNKDKIKDIEKWQKSPYTHELTCGDHDCLGILKPIELDDKVILTCPKCRNYEQLFIPECVYNVDYKKLEEPYKMLNKQKSYTDALKYLNSKKISDCGVFNGVTKAKHLDGSDFLFRYSFIEEDEEFLYIWTEHFGYYVWYKEDLLYYSFKKIKTDPRNELWTIIDDFIFDHEIREEKDIENVKVSKEELNKLIKEFCDTIGYHEDL